jgi:hypothetical protein
MGTCIKICKATDLYSLSQSHLVEECLKEFHQTTEGQTVVGNNTCDSYQLPNLYTGWVSRQLTLDLVELAKMCRIDSFVSRT